MRQTKPQRGRSAAYLYVLVFEVIATRTYFLPEAVCILVELTVQGSLHNPHVECYGVLDEDFNLRKVRLNAKHQDTETHPELQSFKILPASDWLSVQPGDCGSCRNRPPRDFGVEASSAAPGESNVCLCGRVMSKVND